MQWYYRLNQTGNSKQEVLRNDSGKQEKSGKSPSIKLSTTTEQKKDLNIIYVGAERTGFEMKQEISLFSWKSATGSLKITKSTNK